MAAQLSRRTRLTINHRSRLGLPRLGNIVVTVEPFSSLGDTGGVTFGDSGVGITLSDESSVVVILGDCGGGITLGDTGRATLGDVTQGDDDSLNVLSG